MTSNYVIVPIKLYLDVGNDKHIILFNFGGRFVSSFEIMKGDPEAPPSGRRKQKQKARSE